MIPVVQAGYERVADEYVRRNERVKVPRERAHVAVRLDRYDLA